MTRNGHFSPRERLRQVNNNKYQDVTNQPSVPSYTFNPCVSVGSWRGQVHKRPHNSYDVLITNGRESRNVHFENPMFYEAFTPDGHLYILVAKTKTKSEKVYLHRSTDDYSQALAKLIARFGFPNKGLTNLKDVVSSATEQGLSMFTIKPITGVEY